MAYTFADNRYSINGLVKTDNKVMDNLAMLCAAAGCWLTYDFHEGKWSVIINKSGASAWSFNDSNIVGPLTISATGVDGLFNNAKVTYPHEDLQNQSDFIQISIPQSQWFPNEQQNTMNLNYQVVTNPVQAQLLGFIELKQSRVDKIVNFVTDYSKIAVKAGDFIDITNSVYGWTGKMFRVITVKEVDNSEGGINVQITALEYDATVYDESNLVRYDRNSNNGITTLGNIVTPITPTVTTITTDARPRVNITTQVTGGVVEKVEFWITNDVPPGVQVDSNRTYSLLTTVTPKNGGTFPINTNITAEADNLSASNFLIKCRAINSEAASAFSAPSGMIQYVPLQTTQNIDNSTKLGGLAAGVGVLTALNALIGSFGGNANVKPVTNITVGPNAAAAGWAITSPKAGTYQLEIGGSGGITSLVVISASPNNTTGQSISDFTIAGGLNGATVYISLYLAASETAYASNGCPVKLVMYSNDDADGTLTFGSGTINGFAYTSYCKDLEYFFGGGEIGYTVTPQVIVSGIQTSSYSAPHSYTYTGQ